jgi:hypothetical protein
MNYVVAMVVLGVSLYGCGPPTGPSTISVQGDWGGGSRAQRYISAEDLPFDPRRCKIC